MKLTNPIISIVLVVLMVAYSLPHFLPEDANRDAVIGLNDAISQVRDFAETAEKPTAFASSVEKMLSTLHVVAGLKILIKPEKDPTSAHASFCPDGFYITSSSIQLTPVNMGSFTGETVSLHQSIDIIPLPPPPRSIQPPACFSTCFYL